MGFFEVGESYILFPNIIHEVVEKMRMRALEFEVGDQVYLKISPMKGFMTVGKKGKLSLGYIGPYEILQRVGNVAYKLKLPQDLLLFIHCFTFQY